MAKMAGGALLLATLGIGAAVAFLGKKDGDTVTGESGKTWRVVFLGSADGKTSYEVFAPASSFGPHGELSVLRYSQVGSDRASRQITGVGSGVPETIVKMAASDFDLPFDPSRMPAA